MAIKKKGTPEKIQIVPDAEILEQFRKLVEKSITSDKEVKIVKRSKKSKDK